MFRKLRIKFIAVVMVSVAIVLSLVFAGICITEHNRSVENVKGALEEAVNQAAEYHLFAQNDWRLNSPKDLSANPQNNNDTSNTPSFQPSVEGKDTRPNDTPQHTDDAPTPPRIGGRQNQNASIHVPVAVYELDSTGVATAITRATTASIDADVLSEAIAAAQTCTDGHTTLNDLGLHMVKQTLNSATFIAFADTSTTSDWKQLAVTLSIAGLGILAVFFVISLFLSRWALKPVRQAWDSQRQFVADASHDLKTPLTVILANASILLKHPQDSIASQSKWIESTQTEAGIMQGLVSEMLELAQVEERAQLQKDRLDLSDLVDGESLQFESLAFEQGCSYESTIEEGITILGDELRLRKMVSTLIENALKYVDPAGTVTVSLQQKGSKALLKICNTGSAIAEDDLPHIFDRFYRSDKARTSGTGGFGLGLAIARETARAHDGDITCISQESRGTVFSVELPKA